MSQSTGHARPTATTQAGTMHAYVFRAPGQTGVETRPLPSEPGHNEVKLAVEACGVCGTDLHVVEDPPGHPGTPGTILGHEFVARVIEAGTDVTDLAVGDRVVISPNIRCMQCDQCKRGYFSACRSFSTIGIFQDGGLAAQVVVPASACHRIADHVPAPVAALTEPLSCVMNGIDQARPQPGEVAVIHGAGAIGLLFLAVLTAAGVRCLVLEPSPTRRATAQQMGARWVADPAVTSITEILADDAPDGPDISIDAAGTQFATAVQTTRPGGRILLFGFNTRAQPAVQQSEITRRELTVYGTWVGNFTFPAAIRLQEAGVLNLTPMLTHVLPLERTEEAFAALRSGEAVKAVLLCQGDAESD